MTPTTGKLRRLLSKRFNQEEMQNLCQDLRVDYDDLPGEGKIAKIRELIAHLERRNRLDDLITCVKVNRPDLERELQSIEQPSVKTIDRAIAALTQFPKRLFIVLTVILVGFIVMLPTFFPTYFNDPTPTGAVP